MNKLLVVVGPTAVGKTRLGIDLARKFNGEIISGDSMQIYRHLDIGTAKATHEEQQLAQHHLIDIREVSEGFSAFDFVHLAQNAIEEIRQRGKLPIIVGGTGLYIQALLEGYHLGGGDHHESIQARQRALEESNQTDLELKVKLEALEVAKTTDLSANNRRRLARRIALLESGISSVNQSVTHDVLLLGLNTNRDLLYQRINQRVDWMLENGLLDEALWLKTNYSDTQASKAIGYKELFPYFAGDLALEEAVELIKRNSRRYAKRQLTWFRNRMNVKFWDLICDEGAQENLEHEVEKWL
ncbi:MAG: tRNA (adenosine(37)-N6)-dimethylallyltransferase MiaA [Streptococcaceae bacterium]|jgi:tRNA dimethylallyltransferase|nr:tRNA (adenosine(37)-N6)-dimethylallyltransferase MiaA [Streptococcaceae bacterium]